MAIDDIYTHGMAGGWRVDDASAFREHRTFEADVAIVGTGAGGGTAAEILSAAGLNVLMLEEGALRTSASFKDMQELRAYRELYQEGGARASSDGAIAILQGRTVGGSTVVNFTSSFRTPPQTLAHWAAEYGIKGAGEAEMAPWFAAMEARLGVARWAAEPNANNAALRRACERLGWEWHVIPRNVRGCWNSGYCGLGCPVNAKQSMLVTTVPAALKNGARLIHHVRVERVTFDNGRIAGLVGRALDAQCIEPTGITVEVRAKHYILAGGALNTPALLLRSNAPDPHARIGKRTTIHPITLSMARMPDKIDGYYGAPQSIASDEFQWQHEDPSRSSYKIEVAPVFPALASGMMRFQERALTQDMAELPYMQCMGVMLRDGFHDESQGGVVRISDDGFPVLDYDVTDYQWRGIRHAMLSLTDAQFAAGAERVMPVHMDSTWYPSAQSARQAIAGLSMKKFRTPLFTAHLMGGCAMGEDPKRAVVDSEGRFHGVGNLSVFDGSVFPTSIGNNPQLSIYAMTAKNATALAKSLGGKPVEPGAGAN
ncbi:GMC family oxidoreductase [Burkholderia sp. Se-20378]|uniref:GMC family oxidoreductase n=1 Tax=Burkholderia sp. Se-20378 TaxID=2703899 RepID=UPI001982435D|nr:GMC family oxidoreductase [Burkholderia sp. Se-20378]MBN3768077.1 GMC family oxidoreductase [Burkholderia sp. Se-20378]